jgi:YVTN family beta-propeller protein
MYAGLVHASPFAYLANNGDNTVSVLDTATNTVVGTPILVGQGPYGVAINSQGSRVYVSNKIDKTISVINTALLPYNGGADPVIATIQLNNTPGGLAVNAAGTRLFVALNDTPGVDVYSTLTNAKLTSVTVDTTPEGIAAVQTAGTSYKVLVTNYGANSVSVINADDTADTYVKAASDIALPAGSQPKGIAITSNGLYAYVANNGTNNVSKIDIAAGAVVGLPITVGSEPTGVAITSNNATLYVPNTSSGSVTSINLSTLAPTTFTLDGSPNPQYGPYGIAVAPGGFIYTANSLTNNVSIMTAAGAIAAGPVAVGSAPSSLGKFMGPLLHPIGITLPTGYGGYIYPADPLISLNTAGSIALAADSKDLTLNIIPDHNFVTASVKVNGANQPQPLPAFWTFPNVTVDTNTIEATFSRTHWDLTVTKNEYGGIGTGTVTSSPSGISCGPENLTCDQTISIPVGGSVTLTATADTANNSEFVGWGGGQCTGNSSTCVITDMSYNTYVNAHFVKKLTGPARIGNAYYASLAEAYTKAVSGDKIEMLVFADTLNNPFTLPTGFNRVDNVSVTLVGGYTDWTPTLPVGSATIIKADATNGLVIKFGSLTIGSSGNKGSVIIK